VDEAQAGVRVAPARGDAGGGGEDETAPAVVRVGDLQPGAAGAAAPAPSFPQDDVEIEHAGAPALAGAAAVSAFDPLEIGEQGRRGERGFDHRGGVGIAAAGGAEGGAGHGRGSGDDGDGPGQGGQGGGEHPARIAVAGVAAVRAERDEVAPGRGCGQMSSHRRA